MATPKFDLKNIPLQAPKGSNPKDVQYATDQITAEYAPQENTLNRTLEMIGQVKDTDVAAQQKYGEVADQKMAEIGTQLASTLQGGVGATKNIFDQGIKGVGEHYQSGIDQMAAANQGSQNNLKGIAEGLGQASAAGDPLARMEAQFKNTQARRQGNKEAAQSNLETLSASYQAIAQAAVGDSQRNSAQKRNDLMSDVQSAITKIQLQFGESTNELMGKFVDLAETKGAKFRTLIHDAATARNAAELEAAKFQMDAEAHNMDMANKSSMINKRANDTALATEKLLMDLDAAETAKKDTAKNVTFNKGHQGLTAWLRTIYKDPKTGKQIVGSGPKKGAIREFISDIERDSAAAKADGDISSAFERAMHQTTEKLQMAINAGLGPVIPFDRPNGSVVLVPKDEWENALRTYFQGSGGARYGSK